MICGPFLPFSVDPFFFCGGLSAFTRDGILFSWRFIQRSSWSVVYYVGDVSKVPRVKYQFPRIPAQCGLATLSLPPVIPLPTAAMVLLRPFLADSIFKLLAGVYWLIFAQAVSSMAEASGSASGCMDTTVEPYTASVGDQALLAPPGRSRSGSPPRGRIMRRSHCCFCL